jgi:Mg2+-importing ATPase
MNQTPPTFWSISVNDMLRKLEGNKEGLSKQEADKRLAEYGSNLLKPKKRTDVLTLLLSQFKSPIILILLFATVLSYFLHDPVDSFIILIIVLVSGLLGFWQEHSASNAVEKLLSIVQIKTSVARDGITKEIPVEEIVPGDIIVLKAGDIIPGDGLVSESKDLFIDEAMLTGETFPVEKMVSVLPEETLLSRKWYCDFINCAYRKRNRIRQGI